MPTNFQIGDWVTFLPEPEKEFEIIAAVGKPYVTTVGPLPSQSYTVPVGYDFLLKQGLPVEGLEPYKPVKESDIKLMPPTQRPDRLASRQS